MDYLLSKPSPPLSRFIKHYWTFESCVHADQDHTQRIVPSGLPELIFYLGDRPVSGDAGKSINDSTVVTGQLGGYYDLKVAGRLSLFSVIFKPHGMSALFDIPQHQLYNQNVPLKDLLKHDADELETRLSEEGSFERRIEIVERCFLKILQENRSWQYYDRIEHCIDIIDQSRGIADIEDLASETCFSRKQFERHFSSYVGISPKKFLRTVRFQHAVDIRSKERSVSLTDLTYRCGYYDQSHMINDFRKLTGMSPKEYFNDCEPFSDYFQQ